MPDPGENETEEEFMGRCIPMMMDEGMENDQAVAVCARKWEGKSLKIGARHSQSDKDALQSIHDGAVTLGAACPTQTEITEIPFNPEKTLIFYGGEVKALEDGKLGGYLVRFSTDSDPDITGDFFNKDTDFGDLDNAAVYYHHGMDSKLGKKRIGRGNLRLDDVGVWIDAQLQLRDEYEKAIYQMASEGKLGWSSGTASHLVEREPIGKAFYIKSWPLGLDASLTPTPAEPRNEAVTLKSLLGDNVTDETEVEASGEDAPIVDIGEIKSTVLETSIDESEDQTMEMTDEKLQELIASAALKGAEEAIKALPVERSAGIEVVTDEADQPWSHAGEFFKAVKIAAFRPQDEDVRLRPLKATGLSEGVPADGGYLVAPQYATGLWERMYNVGDILRRVAVDNVTGNTMVYNAIDESSRAVGSAYGGVRGYWLSEAGTKTASKPAFRQVELKLKKIAALCYATDELLDDTTALESWITRTVPEVLRFQVEDAIVNGDGVGKPLGIMNSPALVTLLRIDASEVDATDIANLWSRRWTGVNDYVWLIHPTVFPQLINLVVGNFPLLAISGVQGAPFATIYGRPVIETEYNQTLGTSGDIILASLSQYQTIQKGGIQAASSIHVAFTTDESCFRFVYRIDGRSLWHADLTPLHGSSDVSPFVCLGASV